MHIFQYVQYSRYTCEISEILTLDRIKQTPRPINCSKNVRDCELWEIKRRLKGNSYKKAFPLKKGLKEVADSTDMISSGKVGAFAQGPRVHAGAYGAQRIEI